MNIDTDINNLVKVDQFDPILMQNADIIDHFSYVSYNLERMNEAGVQS
jgi:hypothetical protein